VRNRIAAFRSAEGRSIAEWRSEDIRDVSRRSFLDRSLPKAMPSPRRGLRKPWRGVQASTICERPGRNFPIFYSEDEKFPIPGIKVRGQSPQDKVTVIGAGVTLHEALKAADQLEGRRHSRAGDRPYCCQTIDGKVLAKEICRTGGRLITVEDHWAEGGIGEAVLSALGRPASPLPSRSSSRCGRCRTPASRMSSLTAFAFRQDILWRRCAQFHSSLASA